MILCISNQKGGVGKTTTAVNMAGYMARTGSKVLMIDLDPQTNLTTAWGVGCINKNIYATIIGDIPARETIVSLAETDKELTGRLFLIPGSNNFSRYEKYRAGEPNCQFDLKKLINGLEKEFDYIILDCPPALGLITVNALSCSNYVIVPIEAQLFSIEGLNKLSKTVGEIKELINPNLEIGGIFFIRHDKRKILNREVENFIRKEYNHYLLETSIRESIALRESPHEGKDVFCYAPNSNGAKDYECLVKELINKICQERK